MATYTHKRGDTFEWQCVASDPETSDPTDLTGWSVASKLRQNDAAQTLIETLAAVLTDPQQGEFTISATPAQSAAWPVGQHELDIEFTDPGGVVASTETVAFTVARDITF